ncbi:MAG: hypothetical protein ACFBSE_17870 [Prochloraceae cyanobacterium]
MEFSTTPNSLHVRNDVVHFNFIYSPAKSIYQEPKAYIKEE